MTQLKGAGALNLVQVKLSHELKLNWIIKLILMSLKMKSKKATKITSPNKLFWINQRQKCPKNWKSHDKNNM